MNKNKELFEQSEVFIPGGVNSPVRAFGSVGGTPIFFKAGMGSRLIDENDKEYIDYINSWGPYDCWACKPRNYKCSQKNSRVFTFIWSPDIKRTYNGGIIG
jgi:4-aminobutyrate aminotransferase-like enzyme